MPMRLESTGPTRQDYQLNHQKQDSGNSLSHQYPQNNSIIYDIPQISHPTNAPKFEASGINGGSLFGSLSIKNKDKKEEDV